jgi:hypothetical protein
MTDLAVVSDTPKSVAPKEPFSGERTRLTVGFIGLGHMGAGMAANLLKAGYGATVYNRTRSKTADLVARGAKAATDIATICKSNVVITMLANDAAVEDVAFGPGGLIANLPDQRGSIGTTVRGARKEGTAFRRRAGLRPSRCRSSRTAFHCCRWR